MQLPPLDPQQRQKVLLCALMVLGGLYVGYTYGYAPKSAEAAAVQEHVEALKLQNSTARATSQGEGTATVERKLRLFRDQLKAVEGLIPSSEELPDLLDAISAEAQRTGVEVTLIQPVGATEENYYVRRVYDVAVAGRYHAIGEFLTRVGSLPRVITPIDLTLVNPRASDEAEDAKESPRLEARFSLETYVVPTPADANGAKPTN